MRADVRAVLPLIGTPTLLLHRVADSEFLPNRRTALSRRAHCGVAPRRVVRRRTWSRLRATPPCCPTRSKSFSPGPEACRTSIGCSRRFCSPTSWTRRDEQPGSGDRHWQGELLDSHDLMTQRQVQRFEPHMKTTGNGTLATFDSPAGRRDSIRARDAVMAPAKLGLEVRVGVHTGEVKRRGDDVAGIGVHIAARVQARPRVPVRCGSRAPVTDLVATPERVQRPRRPRIRRRPGTWQLFAVAH